MKTLTFFYKYPQIITFMHNVKYHMEVKNKDFPFAIVGSEGVGKSNMLLHFYELWYSVILKREVTDDDIKNIHVNRMDWLNNFKNIKALDINANDEAADGLASKESMKRFGRDLEKLYKVFRKKRFVTPILTPSFFDLPKYFRQRVRMLIWIDKEGHFKIFSAEGVKWLNAKNINKEPKRMDVAYPIYEGVFPIYDGVLRKPYDDMADEGSDRILDEVIADNTDVKKVSAVETYREEVENLYRIGFNKKEIREKVGTSPNTISQILKESYKP